MTEPGRPNPTPWHAEPPESALAGLRSGVEGLSREEARARLEHHGPNRIEPPPPPPWWRLVLRQFASPLIYILIAAALIALALRELADTAFIVVVLMINAVDRARERVTCRAQGALPCRAWSARTRGYGGAGARWTWTARKWFPAT